MHMLLLMLLRGKLFSFEDRIFVDLLFRDQGGDLLSYFFDTMPDYNHEVQMFMIIRYAEIKRNSVHQCEN